MNVWIRVGTRGQVDARSVQEKTLVIAADRHLLELFRPLPGLERGVGLVHDRDLARYDDLRLLSRELQRHGHVGLLLVLDQVALDGDRRKTGEDDRDVVETRLNLRETE